ncbi:MAG: histidine kinase dimerization/phospho-acceptor domain-containing protein [Pseudomonadota bacterium]
MFFDDRLATVLRQESASDAAKRTQFRQLLDILGNRKFGSTGRSDRSLIAAAWLRMDALGRSIPAKERAAMIREPSWRFRSADLAAHLADFEPDVASAALTRAELSEDDWTALIPRLPVRARGFLRLRRDLPSGAEALLDRLGVRDRGLPLPSGTRSEAEIIERENNIAPELPPEPIDLDDEAEVESKSPVDPRPANDHEPIDLKGWEAEPEPEREAKVTPITPDPVEAGRSEISALVERIARFKRTREEIDPEALIDSERSPRLPLGEVEAAQPKRAAAFGFSADAAGRIDWAEAEVAPMVIGRRLIARQPAEGAAQEAALARVFNQRQPIMDARTNLEGAPSIAGEWGVDAHPRFTAEGHFSGYVGRFRRLPDTQKEAEDTASQEADRVRQLLHELRTPVTAVQGYAEVIQQQLFGPAPHEYRALAAAIAADAARILAGFEELDRLARLEIGALEMEEGHSELGAIVRQTQRQLAQVLSPRMASLDIAIEDDADFTIALETEEAERLLWRYLATLAGACGANETLKAGLENHEGQAHLVCDLPRQLLEEPEIFATEAKPTESAINAGVFGAGFALRLARAEAQSSGGDLVRIDDRLRLTLPLREQLGEGASLTSG